MADQNIKKVVIKNLDLPEILTKEQGYLVKYRVISEDKNRSSHWSPIQLIQPNYTFVPGIIKESSVQGITTFAWDSVTIKIGDNIVRQAHEFDIWIRFDRNDSGDWIYKQRIDGNTYSIPHPTQYTKNGIIQAQAPNRVSVEIFLKGTPISRTSSFLKVYESLNITI